MSLLHLRLRIRKEAEKEQQEAEAIAEVFASQPSEPTGALNLLVLF